MACLVNLYIYFFICTYIFCCP